MEQQCDFQYDLVHMMTYVDIPLEKITEMKPFLKKYYSQGCVITTPDNFCQMHVPHVFDEHFLVLKEKLANKLELIIIDEMTPSCDKSVLNVVVGHLEKIYLVNIVFMEKLQMLSQTVLKGLSSVGIGYNNICCFVTDNIT